MWMSRRSGRRLELPARHLAEHADDVAAPREAHGAHLALEALSVRADDHARRVGCALAADDLLCEDLPRMPSVPGGDDGRELTSAAIADELACRRVQPADDARRVDHVARDADRLERLLDVGVELLQPGHAPSRLTGSRRSST